MQLDHETHFDEIVIPAVQAYYEAERRLTEAVVDNDLQASRPRYAALREGGAAAFYLHHFAEIVIARQPSTLPRFPKGPKGLAALRAWLAAGCFANRTGALCTDVRLLGQVVNALKHADLTIGRNFEVSSDKQVITVASGYGPLPYGEGKYGGVDAVIVLGKSRNRALNAVIQNVLDAWFRRLGRPLLPL